MAFKFNSLIRRASSSLMRSRGGVICGRFPPFVRFLTESVDISSPPPPKEAAEETSGKVVCTEGPDRIRELNSMGAMFDHGEDGNLIIERH